MSPSNATPQLRGRRLAHRPRTEDGPLARAIHGSGPLSQGAIAPQARMGARNDERPAEGGHVWDRAHAEHGSVLRAALAVHVAVRRVSSALGFAHFDDLDVEIQVLAGHRVVEVDVDHAHADLLDGHRARAEVGLQHDLLARLAACCAPKCFLGTRWLRPSRRSP